MTKLFLLRHAKAALAASGTSDFDRPLEASGRADARKAGRHLLARWGAPERAVCSAARRARETLEAAELNIAPDKVAFSRDLFEQGADSYLAALQDGDAASVLLVGHNPSVHECALSLVGGGDAALRKALAGKFPTATLAVLHFAGPASDLRPGGCILEALITPADLAAA